MLGWLDTPLPDRFYHLAWGILVATILVDPFRQARVEPVARALYLAVFALTFAGVLLALYVATSDVGAPAIRGVQGRYFVPLLPLLGVALGIGVDGRPWLRGAATTAAALFAATSAGVTVVGVVERYYA